MKRNKTILLTILVLGLLAAAYFLFFKKDGGAKVVLTAERPERGRIASVVTSTGTIQPVDTVAVGTQVSGIISAIYTDYNAEVKEGQLLAELDATLLQASVNQIDASLRQARSNLSFQTSNYNRQQELYHVGAISRATYETALNSYEVAKASVENIEAQLTAAKQNLSFTKIYSPINGVVLNRNVSVGQTVAASFNTPTLFMLAKDITKMQVEAKVDEADIGNVKPGQRVTFTVDAFVNDVFNGTVSEIRLQPTTSSNVVTYTTIIEANNDEMKLKPGMTATITIYTEEADGALLIPVSALKFTPDLGQLAPQYQVNMPEGPPQHPDSIGAPTENNRAVVWVVNGNVLNGKLITTGINDNTKVQVLSGLTPEDSVVTSGNMGDMAISDAQGEGGSPFMPRPPGRR